MAISQKDYSYRANQLLALDFEDATPRILGFVEWLDNDHDAAAALKELRDRDILPLIKDSGHQRPPKAKTPEDVAAIGLAIIDNAREKNSQIFRIGMALGIRAAGSRIQDSSDEVIRRFIRPLLQYLEKRLFESEVMATPAPATSNVKNPKDVFVVHGRNEKLRSSLFAFLRAIGLNPLEWESLVASTKKGAPYIGEILDGAFKRAGAVVVLLSPDDEGRLKPEFVTSSDGKFERELTGQARGNVLFEAGMAFGHKEDKTILVEIGTIRPFSDVAGRHVIHLTNEIASRQKLINRLRTVGCDVDQSGVDWHDQGDFSGIETPSNAVSNLSGTLLPNASRLVVSLSRDALLLLKEASKDPSGEIMRMELGASLVIQTNGKQFTEGDDPRSQARWEGAMDELEGEKLIKAATHEREYFKVTGLGYEVAAKLVD